MNWIKLEDNQPEDCQIVLCWMPLPAPPEEKMSEKKAESEGPLTIPITQADCQFCYDVLLDEILRNDKIFGCSNAWVGAMLTLICESFHASNLTYEQFCNEMDLIKDNYKYLWNEV